MLLGKRPRPPIRRTTSMTGITVDLSDVEAQPPTDHHHVHATVVVGPQGPLNTIVDQNNNNNNNNSTNLGYHEEHRFLAMLSPRSNQRKSSTDIVETAHFLRTCGLCKRRLASGRDIYMYRGEIAFCSLECREQQMKQDERREKCKAGGVASKRDEHRHAASRTTTTTTTTATTSKASAGKSQTVVAG